MERAIVNIRRVKPDEASELWQLKYRTIREYCCKDYSAEQVAAWAPDDVDEAGWAQRVAGMNPFVAVVSGSIAGFADLQPDGYIDHFFCGLDHIGQGVGGHLMRRLLQEAEVAQISRLYSQVSISAKPFFEHFGFKVVKAQRVEVRGVELSNYLMELENSLV